MKQQLIKLGLFLISLILIVPAFFIGIPITLIYGLFKKGTINYLFDALLDTALGIDLLGNIVFKDFLNTTCITNSGYHFGEIGKTISHGLGVNKAKGTLTDFGRGLANLLNFIDPNHVEKAIT